MTTNPNAGQMNVAKLFSSLAAVFKAVPEDKLADLHDVLDHNGAADISDMWNKRGGEHSAPSRAEIVTGAAEKMSGGNAEPMIRRYSDGSTQEGLTALYARFEGILSDFGKSMTADFNKKLGALADVVSQVAKNQTAFDAMVKAATEASTKAADPTEDTFFGKAQLKLEKARKAFRKAEMEEDEEKREERKSRLTDISETLKSALKLISKADDEEKHEDEEVEKAVAAVKALAGKVSVALAAITKAEDDEKKDEEEKAEKARQAAEAASKAAATGADAGGAAVKSDTEEEEKKDDTAKALASIAASVDQLQKAGDTKLEVVQATLKGMMDTIMGVSRDLAKPPTLAVIKGGLDPETKLRTALDSGDLNGQEAVMGQTFVRRHQAMTAGQYPADKFTQELSAAPESVRAIFA